MFCDVLHMKFFDVVDMLLPIYCSQKGWGCKRPVEVVSTSSFLSNAADSSLGVALARWIQLENTKCWLAPLALTN